MYNPDPNIVDALRRRPPAPLPESFVGRVMAHIEPVRPRFRLEFLDIAVPAFMAAFAMIVLGTGFWVLGRLDPLWWPKVQTELALLSLYLGTMPAWPWIAGGLAALSAVAVALVLLPATLVRLARSA
ncbi:MAG: hypothetical protein R3335_07905 [Anaerolineales bacterium]|nr:hypothetical protein [Anaerolineales bacterium]